MKNDAPIPSLYILIFSAVLWTISAALPFGISYEGQSYSTLSFMIYGWRLLLEAGNVAWLANIAFIAAAVLLGMKNKAAFIAAIFALIFSLDFFRLEEAIFEGQTKVIFGFSYGMAVWVAANFLIVLAAALQNMELDKPLLKAPINQIFAFAAAIGMLGFIFFVVYLSINDRRSANEQEATRISDANILFKKGQVCNALYARTSFIFDSQKIKADKPIEIVNYDELKPFDKPTTLLDWGIPIVRMGNYDYSYTIIDNKKVLKAQAKLGDGSASLMIKKSSDIDGGESIAMEMTNWDRNETYLSQKWQKPAGTPNMCPDYFEMPDATQEPRQMVVSTVNSSFITDFDNIKIRNPKKRVGQILTSNPLNLSGIDVSNIHCGERTGFMKNDVYKKVAEKEPSFKENGLPFQINASYYFMQSIGKLKSACTKNGNIAYVYTQSQKASDVEYTIYKMKLPEFEQKAAITASIKGLGKQINLDSSSIINIDEISNELVFDIYDNASKNAFKLMATMVKTTQPISSQQVEQLKASIIKDPLAPEEEVYELPILDDNGQDSENPTQTEPSAAEEEAVDLAPL